MVNNLVQFKIDLLAYLFGCEQDASAHATFINLIRKHEKLTSAGDLSFPSLQNDKIWKGSVEKLKQKDGNELAVDLIKASSSFSLEVSKILVEPKIIRIFLKRKVAFEAFFNTEEIRENVTENTTKVINYEKQKTGASCMSIVRCDAVMGVIGRILQIEPLESPSGIVIGVSTSDAKHLLEQMHQKDQTNVAVKVGPVMTLIKEKDGSDIVNLLKNIEKEMKEVEAQRESQVVEGSSKLLAAAHVQFELLESSVAQPVVLGSKGEQSKVAFVMYNLARIRQILRVFQEKVTRGTYPQLPARKDIDWDLLSEEDEWSLLFLHLMEYSSLLKAVAGGLAKGELAVHKLCQFLVGLSGTFSRYYSRVRVLREPLPQLLPTLFARIYLLKAVDQVMFDAMWILDIRTVDRM